MLLCDLDPESTMYEPTRRNLLRDLTGAAGAGLVGSRLLGHPDEDDADAATPSCTLSPEVTEGPYYLDPDRIRRDVTEGKPGLRLDLRITFVSADTCKPTKDACGGARRPRFARG